MTQALLSVENLNVEIPLAGGVLHAVSDVSLEVHRGETLAIVGESGCGKSMTSLAIMDLLPKLAVRKAARMELGGSSILNIGERRMSDIRGDRIGMIFQEPMTSLNPSYSIGNQLEEAMTRHRRVRRKDARDRAIFLLEKVGITGARSRLGHYPHQLSGGLRQRVMIAMTLMCDPDLIIADEPTTALDVTIQAQILRILSNAKAEFGAGLILITHDLGVVAAVADRVAVMYAGKIVEMGKVEDVFRRPAHPYTQGLLECIPIPGKTRRGERLGSIPGIVPSFVGDVLGCRFADRCRYSTAACRSADIELRWGPGDQHLYRCLLEPEQALAIPRRVSQ